MSSLNDRQIWQMLLCLIFSSVCVSTALAGRPPRYVIVSDMTYDDGNSLIRLLYYANEIDDVGPVMSRRCESGHAKGMDRNADWKFKVLIHNIESE